MVADNRYVMFDLIRGISAILVCAGHLRAGMFISYADVAIEEKSLFMAAFYFITSLGHEAVMVFFVLSGFFVGGGILRKERNCFIFSRYIVERVSRLWIVLIPAIIFTLAVDFYIGRINPLLLDGGAFKTLNSGPTDLYSVSIGTFISNLFFLQNILTPVFGSNGPLWSLTNEFWYYIIFPILMIAARRVHSNVVIANLATFLVPCFLAFFYIYDLLIGFFIWLIGAIVAYIYQRCTFILNRGYTWAAFFLFVISILVGKTKLLSGVGSDLLIGISFGFLLVTMRGWDWKIKGSVKMRNGVLFISDISYTLYLFHFPIVLLIFSIFYRVNKVVFDFYNAFIFIGWLTLLIALGAFFWYCFERHSNRLKAILLSKIDKNYIYK